MKGLTTCIVIAGLFAITTLGCGGEPDWEKLAREELVVSDGLSAPSLTKTADKRTFEFFAKDPKGLICKGTITVPEKGSDSKDFKTEMQCKRSTDGNTATSPKGNSGERTKAAKPSLPADPYKELQKQCDDGALEICTKLGEQLVVGAELSRDEKRARTVHAAACEKGANASCEALGVLIRRGIGGGKNPEKGNALFAKACDSGHMSGCTRLAVATYVDGDKRGSFKLFQKACAGGDMSGCDGLGEAWRLGYGGKRDVKKARHYYEKACHGGDLGGCVHLGEMFERGTGGPKSASQARELYEVACEDGHQTGCVKLQAMGP